ncbi:PEP-CTERM sorting domain-containing protein [Pseudoduganella chitinolytica]|uniref:PEP-CTERM sorting domain-containing protein n=1 Tax=Pseudoduganella chitinolytica TaxID=34070 RepID=A0ABY8BFY2_9BURK|nr:PEP-CTERM sorting domain-containing protein [Pseudoduganella chitinolytica]WEF34830.1 PEP-CTERM sorting domain-containing protein [Pseudoduganella chitinolytica]
MHRSLVRPLTLVALLYAGAAHAAAPYVETSAFTLQGHEGYPDSVVNVLSDTAQSVTLSLPTMAELSTAEADSTHSPGGGTTVTVSPALLYDITPREGYRITGFNLVATVQGTLLAGGGPVPGSAFNYITLSYEVRHPRGAEGGVLSSNFQDEHQMTLGSPLQWLDTPFGFHLSSYVNLVANGGYFPDPDNGEPSWSTSIAGVTMRDVTLTFTVSPVPEPQTWLLMLSGLTAVGAAALRSRKRA